MLQSGDQTRGILNELTLTKILNKWWRFLNRCRYLMNCNTKSHFFNDVTQIWPLFGRAKLMLPLFFNHGLLQVLNPSLLIVWRHLCVPPFSIFSRLINFSFVVLGVKYLKLFTLPSYNIKNVYSLAGHILRLCR